MIRVRKMAMVWILVPALLAGACSGGDSSDPDDAIAGDSVDEETSVTCPAVVKQYLEIAGEPIPDNPVTGDGTPSEFNRVRYIRYRADTGADTPRPVDAILVMLPGFTVGTGYLTYMARSLVRMSCGRMEVWLAERRHHLLEDPTGMIAAEAAGDPWIANGYYFDGQEVDGKTFAGFIDGNGPDSAIISEWGLDIAMKDIRSVIRQVPESARQATVFLGGQSRGVAYVRAYAAYEFEDGRLGCEDLAGLVLVDGDSQYKSGMSEETYLEDLQAIRSGDKARFVTVPPVGPPIYTFLEILAMASSEGFGDPADPQLGPDGRFPEFGPLEPLLPLLFRQEDIQMTNEAFFGFATDTDSAVIDILRAGLGAMDGPVAEDTVGLYPSDPDHLYTWKHWDEVDPVDFCEIQDLLKSLWEGPSNATDPYYASRLDLDFFAADKLETAGAWRDKYFTFRSSDMDAPVYNLGSHILHGQPERVTDYRDRIAPVRGQDLPRSEYGFDILWKPEWEHIDTVFAVAETNDFFMGLVDWMRLHSKGEVQVPVSGE